MDIRYTDFQNDLLVLASSTHTVKGPATQTCGPIKHHWT